MSSLINSSNLEESERLLTSVVVEMEADLEAVERERDALRDKVAFLEEHVRHKDNRIDHLASFSLGSPLSIVSPTVATSPTRGAHRRRLLALEGELAEARAHNRVVEEHRQELTAEVRQLRSALADTDVDRSRQLERVAADLSAVVAERDVRLAAAAADLSAIRAQFLDFKADTAAHLAAGKADMDAVSRGVAALTGALSTAVTKADGERKSLEVMANIVKTAMSERTTMLQDLETSTEDVDVLRAALAASQDEVARLRSQVGAREREIDEMREELGKAKQVAAKSEATRQRYVQYKAALDASQNAVSDMRAEHNREVGALRSQLAKAEADLLGEQAGRGSSHAELQSMAEALQAAQEQIAAAAAETNRLREAESGERVRDHERIRQLETDLRRQKSATAEALAQLQTLAVPRESADMEHLRKALETQADAFEELTMKLARTRKDRDDERRRHAAEVQHVQAQADKAVAKAIASGKRRLKAAEAQHASTLAQAARMSSDLAAAAKSSIIRVASPERASRAPSGSVDSSLVFSTPERRVDGHPFSTPPARVGNGTRRHRRLPP